MILNQLLQLQNIRDPFLDSIQKGDVRLALPTPNPFSLIYINILVPDRVMNEVQQISGSSCIINRLGGAEFILNFNSSFIFFTKG